MLCYCHFCFNVPTCPFGNDTKEKDHSTFCGMDADDCTIRPTHIISFGVFFLHFLVKIWYVFMYDVQRDHVTSWIKSTFLCFVIQNKKKSPSQKEGRIEVCRKSKCIFNQIVCIQWKHRLNCKSIAVNKKNLIKMRIP